MLETYKLRMASMGGYDGEARRRNSQKIMDVSWMRDAATRPVYVKWVDNGLPMVDDDDIPVYAKYNVKSYHNITGDEIAYLLQFRLDDMKNNPNIKVGSYVQILNEMDEPEWWLIWHLDDRNQFRQYSIVKCTHIYRWLSLKDGKRVIHECLGCPRNQSSYNSGVWLDYTTQVVENQHILVMPTNEDSKTITYDTKFLISDPGRYPPLAWKVSKVAPSLNGDITKFTMTQEQFDPIRDNAKLMIANYYDGVVNPKPSDNEEITHTASNLEITYSNMPSVKAGGGYKKFCLQEYVDGILTNVTNGIVWSIDGNSIDPNDTDKYTIGFGGKDNLLACSIQDNIFKVKCINDYSLIGSTFTITATTKDYSKSLVVEVTAL